jgi:hypothetical protein
MPIGAVVWRAANGSKPDPTYLMPVEADAALEQLLDAAVHEPTDPRGKRVSDHMFREACEAWLAYVAHEKDRRPSTIGDYRKRGAALPRAGVRRRHAAAHESTGRGSTRTANACASRGRDTPI